MSLLKNAPNPLGVLRSKGKWMTAAMGLPGTHYLGVIPPLITVAPIIAVPLRVCWRVGEALHLLGSVLPAVVLCTVTALTHPAPPLPYPAPPTPQLWESHLSA